MDTNALFQEASLLVSNIEMVYSNWLDNVWKREEVDQTHTCTSMCDLTPIDALFSRDALGCEKSGQLHVCGSNCDRSQVIDKSTRVCELTGRVLSGVIKSASRTFSESTVAFENKMKNSILKRKRNSRQTPKVLNPTFLKAKRTQRVKTRKRSKSTKKRSAKPRKQQIRTTEQERIDISKALDCMFFHREHITVKRYHACISSSTTALNNFMRKNASEKTVVRYPNMVSSAFLGIPFLEGRKPIQANQEIPLVREICEFLVKLTAEALSHYRNTRYHIMRCRANPAYLNHPEIIASQYDNASSHINAFQFAVAFIFQCCHGKKSRYDNRNLIPVISFLTLFAPRESDMPMIFADDSYKTCLNLAWFMDFADQLYSLGMIPKDPSLTPDNLFYKPQSTHGYESQPMLLLSTTSTVSLPKMEEVSLQEPPRASEIIHVPRLTTEFATFLSEKSTTGARKVSYWCLLTQKDGDHEVSIATTTEIHELRQKTHLIMVFGSWSSQEQAETVLQSWNLDHDAVTNGISLVKKLKESVHPNIAVYVDQPAL